MTKKLCLPLVVSCVLAVTAFAAPPDLPEIKMGNAVEFANAGISLAAPSGFEFRPLTEAYDVARAVLMEGANKAAGAVSLTVYPIAEKTTAEQFADAMTAEVQKNIAVSGFTVLKAGTMQVAGQEAQVRLVSYSFRGVKTVTARAFFVRDGKSGSQADKFRICYALTVESSDDRKDTLMPIFAAVIKSIKITTIQRPLALPIGELDVPLKEYKLGYEVRQPKNWYVSITPTGAEMGQTDYTMGGMPMPCVRVIVTDAGGQGSAQDIAHKSLEDFKKKAASDGEELKVISEGPAKLAGKIGYQYVIEQLPAKTASTTSAHGATPNVVVQRTVVDTDNASGEQKCYSLRLFAQTDNPKVAERIMDKIAGGFGLLNSTASTSSPASASEPAGVGK